MLGLGHVDLFAPGSGDGGSRALRPGDRDLGAGARVHRRPGEPGLTPGPRRARLLRFVAAGAIAAGVLYVVNVLFLWNGVPPFAAGLAAYGAAFATGYGLQRFWTFRGVQGHRRTLSRYLVLQAGCAGLSGGLNALLAPLAPASILSVGVTLAAAVASYLGSAYWAFAPPAGERGSETPP